MITTVTEEFFYDEDGKLIKKVVTTVTNDQKPSFPSPNPWLIGDPPYPQMPQTWCQQPALKETYVTYNTNNSA
jgi:hypothetical protein